MPINNFLFQGGIQFSDGSSQSTANIKPVPNGLTGSNGDKAGTFTYDDSGIYLCTKDYNPTQSYTLSFYLHRESVAYTTTNVDGNDLTGWTISNMINPATGSIVVPDNTTVVAWIYSESGSIIEWNNSINDFGILPEGQSASFVVTQQNQPIIWKKSSWD